MRKLVLLVSGRGSNMEAIVRAGRERQWPAVIEAVIASRRDAPAVALARGLGLPVRVVDHRDYPLRADFDAALADEIARFAPDYILLAGFMRVLGEAFVARHAGRLLNIHPSLLPAFAGLSTHRRALAAGVAVHGATVHLVTAALDGGPVIAQAAVPVLAGDDEQRLAQRVLDAEHRLYPQVVQWLLDGRLRLRADAVEWPAGMPVRCLGVQWDDAPADVGVVAAS